MGGTENACTRQRLYQRSIRSRISLNSGGKIRQRCQAREDYYHSTNGLYRNYAKAQKELAEKDQQLSEKDQQLSEKNQQLSEKDQQLSEKNQQLSFMFILLYSPTIAFPSL